MAESLRDKLLAGKFVMTAEVTPPLSADPDDLMKKAGPLKGYADAVNWIAVMAGMQRPASYAGLTRVSIFKKAMDCRV